MNGLKAETGVMTLRQPGNDTLLVSLAGVWKIGNELPSADEVRKGLESTPARRMVFETRDLTDWDSA
jgi:hypothetical protein